MNEFTPTRLAGLPFQMRISVTNLHTSPNVLGQHPNDLLVEHRAMAKPKRPEDHGEDMGSDPIAAALKQMHDVVAGEDLPEDFLRLLDEIDTKIASKNAAH
jgi:hypothetical protein